MRISGHRNRLTGPKDLEDDESQDAFDPGRLGIGNTKSCVLTEMSQWDLQIFVAIQHGDCGSGNKYP